MKIFIFNGLIILAFLAIYNCEKCVYEMNVEYVGKEINVLHNQQSINVVIYVALLVVVMHGFLI